jgi:MoaA/NifB/PqqE/SkfB family radical SAM enzyme
MPNILLTTRCNLACSYCFAQEKLSSTRMNMPMASVQKVIEFLQRSDFPIFRVMGGEPTLHPQFDQIITTAIQAGLRVDVLSNATWKESTAALFERIPTQYLMFLLNIDHPDNYSEHQWGVIQRNLSALKGRGGITLSFNIFEKQPRSDYVIELARQYDFKYIRLSLSLPVLGAGNTYLPIEELQQVAPFVMRFAAKAEAKGISVQFDNAVPMCIFDEAQLGHLLLHGVYDLNRNTRCDPIIDIGPDLTIWSCFCLSPLKNRKLDEFTTLAEAQEYYRSVWRVYQDAVYPLEACYSCYYRKKWGCQGGCLTYAIMTDQGQRYAVEPISSDGKTLNPSLILSLADDVRVFHYDTPRSIHILRKTSTNLELEVEEIFLTILPLLDGRHTLGKIISALASPTSGSNSMQSFMRGILAENMAEFLQALLEQGFLKSEQPEKIILSI